MDDFSVAVTAILATASFVTGAFVLFAREWRGREDAMARAMRALGLAPAATERADYSGALFEGTIAGYRVTLERMAIERRLRIAVDSGGRIPRPLRWGQKAQEPAALQCASDAPSSGKRARPQREGA